MVRNPFKEDKKVAEEIAEKAKATPDPIEEEIQYKEVAITNELLNAKLNFVISKLDLLLEVAEVNK